MVAQAGVLRFYVDESALGLGKALEAARKDTIYVGHRLIPECRLGVGDVEWIRAVADRNLVAIGRDKHIRTRPAELMQIRVARLRVLRIGGKRDLSTWDWLVRVVKRWNEIEALIDARPQGPWINLINDRNLVEVPLIDPT